MDTVLFSSRSETLPNPTNKTTNLPAKRHLKEEEVQDAAESLPREADGFDWTENAVRLSEISDGMAALSINPEGAGYLGRH